MSRNTYSPPEFPAPWASAWGHDAQGLWQTLRIGQAQQTFRWLPGGSFRMGSPEDEKGRFDRETLRVVELEEGFWLADTACTQGFWEAVMGKNPADFSDDPEKPVERVSWDDVQEFFERLGEQEPGLSPRLPSEQEWEYACRAGSETAFHWGEELDLSRANYNGLWEEWGFTEDAPQGTRPVRSYAPNAWGLYEMHGNVWEWCEDEPDWEEDAQERAARRVVRGGSWGVRGRRLRSAGRGRSRRSWQVHFQGFRFSPGHPVRTGAGARGDGTAGQSRRDDATDPTSRSSAR